MIGHQHIGDEFNTVGFTAICQSIQKNLSVFVGQKYILSTVAPVHHVKIRTRIFDSQWPRHGALYAYYIQFVNFKDLTPFFFCMEMLSISKEKGISIYAVKGGWELNGSIQSKVMAMAFSIAAEIERDLISKRTIEALRARKAAGVKLGRPKGPGKSKLDEYREEIVALLKNGSTKSYVAKKYGTTLPNLYNWLKKNEIEIRQIQAA